MGRVVEIPFNIHKKEKFKRNMMHSHERDKKVRHSNHRPGIYYWKISLTKSKVIEKSTDIYSLKLLFILFYHKT